MSSSPENQISAGSQANGSEEFVVVRNHEGQYSIWPATREIPAGWEQSGPRAGRETCLDYIEENWKDIRPLSVQRRLADAATETP